MTTELEPAAETEPTPTAWEASLPQLRARFPGATDGILYCVFKLEQNSSLGLRDFREEARRHGIGVAGRALHSAKALLGLGSPTTSPRPRKSKKAPVPTPPPPRPHAHAVRHSTPTPSLEEQLVRNLQLIQERAGSEAQRLREAMRQAIAVLEDALRERDDA